MFSRVLKRGLPLESCAKVRRVFDLTGVVQGVGLRPSIYQLAGAADLCGWVQNRTGVVRPGVFIFELSARTGAGMKAWLDYLVKLAG